MRRLGSATAMRRSPVLRLRSATIESLEPKFKKTRKLLHFCRRQTQSRNRSLCVRRIASSTQKRPKQLHQAKCALLHDTLEDTEVSYSDLSLLFTKTVADGVQALSKNPQLPKAEQMRDSLARIQQQPYEVWLVKLADRINNLQYAPPYWSEAKIQAYKDEAELILQSLGAASAVLSQRLAERIQVYGTELAVTPHQHLVNDRV